MGDMAAAIGACRNNVSPRESEKPGAAAVNIGVWRHGRAEMTTGEHSDGH